MKNGNAFFVLVAAVVGGSCGFTMSTYSLFPEFVERLRWSLSGGGGERADWGEPLFYMVVMGVPVAVLGAVVGSSLVGIGLWLSQKTRV